jgi:hypothetical protein
MPEPLRVHFCSPFNDTEGLSRLAIFFDEIHVPRLYDALADVSPPGAQLPNSGPVYRVPKGHDSGGAITARITAMLSSDRLAADPDITLLRDAGLLFLDSGTEAWIYSDVVLMDNIHRLRATYGDAVMARCSRLLDVNEWATPREYAFVVEALAFSACRALRRRSYPLTTDSVTIHHLLAAAEDLFRSEDSGTTASMDDEGNKEAGVALRLATLMLPDLHPQSVSDVLEIRARLHDELEAFRVELARLSACVQAEVCEPGFAREVDNMLHTRVMPALAEMDSRLRTSKHKFLLRMLQSLRQPQAYTPFIGTLFLNLPVLPASMLSLGLSAAEAAVRTDIERRHIRDASGLAFLLDVKHAFRRD